MLKRSIVGVGLPNLTSTIISNYKTSRLVDGARTTRYDLAFGRNDQRLSFIVIIPFCKGARSRNVMQPLQSAAFQC
ncbi:hypothetical protein N8310_08700 [Pseudomonadota bacterium]|nr:hypothetical protein [Pseudomonadota bacterium]